MESKAYDQFRKGIGHGSASAFWPKEAIAFADRALMVTGHGNVGFVYDDVRARPQETRSPVTS